MNRAQDARAELQQLATRLRDALLTVAWRQWRVLGAAAANRSPTMPALRVAEEGRRDQQALVDPEALVLISLTLLEHERRLGDLLHSWGARNSGLLSVQRTKNLLASFPEPIREPLTQRVAWFAKVAWKVGKDGRWKSLAEKRTGLSNHLPTTAVPQQEPLDDLSYVRGRGAHGPSNGSTKVRATRAQLTAGSTLLLRLRLGLGVGIKADLIAFLLARGDEAATVRDIVAASGYTLAAVRRAADDLASARLIESVYGQPARYRARHSAWAPLLALHDSHPRWASWHERFQFCTAFLHWSDTARERPLSDYAFSVHGRQLFEHYRPAFERDAIATWSDHSPVLDWGAFVHQSVLSLADWMESMA